MQALSDQEKERFENMAKEYKRRMRGQPGDAIRQDNVGNIIAVSFKHKMEVIGCLLTKEL